MVLMGDLFVRSGVTRKYKKATGFYTGKDGRFMQPLKSNIKSYLCPGCGLLQECETVINEWSKCVNCGADILVTKKIRQKQTPISNHWILRSNNTEMNKVMDNPNCTFLGGLSDQPFTAFYIWEKFFLKYGTGIKGFIEFGCDQGNTSVFFLLWCINLEAEYIGFDKRGKATYQQTPVQRLLRLHKKIRYGNGYKRSEEIKELIQSKGKTVMFTDCIDKPWEFENFAPMLKRGDILAVHDWDRAIKDEWVESTFKKMHPFCLLYEKERIALNTLTRFFKKE